MMGDERTVGSGRDGRGEKGKGVQLDGRVLGQERG